MPESNICPKCNSDLTYEDQGRMICSQCSHEWTPAEEAAETSSAIRVLDSNGAELQNGDTVVVIKDLPVKGASKSIKVGTKVKNIRLTEGDHNIDCRIEGFGAIGLKSEFVKKA